MYNRTLSYQEVSTNKGVNKVYNHFFFPSEQETISTYWFENEPSWSTNTRYSFEPYYDMILTQGHTLTVTEYRQQYLSDFLSNIGGLFTAIMTTARFLLLGYQNFAYTLTHIKLNYAVEASDDEAAVPRQASVSQELLDEHKD